MNTWIYKNGNQQGIFLLRKFSLDFLLVPKVGPLVE